MPTVSVVMPVFNREKYLPAAIDSIRAQTMDDWELVISDSGSTDTSMDIARRYGEKDGRIRVLSRPGANIPENRNAAIAETTGEYIAMLDSDDVAQPERLALQVEYLRQHPELSAIGGNFDFIDGDGNPLRMRKFEKRLTDPDALRRHVMLGWHCFLQSTMLFRRDAIERVGGYRSLFRCAEEDDLYYRLYLDGASMANLPNRLASYRWHGGNTCIPSVTTQLYRVVALASAYCRLHKLSDPTMNRRAAPDYPFLLELFAVLGDHGLPVRLFWIGLLQAHGVGGYDILLEAWRDALPLPAGRLEEEILRHWHNCRGKHVVAIEALRKVSPYPPRTVGAIVKEHL